MQKKERQSVVLGISCYYHDSAAALVVDGNIVCAVHEERFTRIKQDESFPTQSIRFILNEYGLKISDISLIAFYEKPFLKFERLLETYHSFGLRGFKSFAAAMPVWIKDKLFMRSNIWKEIEKIEEIDKDKRPVLIFPEHHLSHMASAFYPSPFQEAAILTLDGVGEFASVTIGYGTENKIKIISEIDFPHSLGLFYSAFTYYCGFKINSGEYKLMGLAPYAKRDDKKVRELVNIIKEKLIRINQDGSFFLNMEYFDFATDLRTVNDNKWTEIFKISPRKGESDIEDEYINLAMACQLVTEEVVLGLANRAKVLTGSKNLVMSGGVALNCVANAVLRDANIFEKIWVQPASGDAGGALGSALAGSYIYMEEKRSIDFSKFDAMNGSYLGPEYSNETAINLLAKYKPVYRKYDNIKDLCEFISEKISTGNVVGWFQGRMEYGPRALGNRSILADPRNPEMQKKLNLKIKYREGFRPFAPAVLEEDAGLYFESAETSPYMLFTTNLRKERRLPESGNAKKLLERLNTLRSDVPSITHLDYSARFQTVSKATNPRFHKLIETFKEKTGYGMLVNTSFNVRNEPIVCNPFDAYKCLMNTEMDILVVGDLVYEKSAQIPWEKIDINKLYGLD